MRESPVHPHSGSVLSRCALLAVVVLLGACVSDTSLIEENAAIALRSVRFQARDDLDCPHLEESVESERVIPGAPWGFFYTDYRIRAEGCGRHAVYDVECRDERLCRVKPVK